MPIEGFSGFNYLTRRRGYEKRPRRIPWVTTTVARNDMGTNVDSACFEFVIHISFMRAFHRPIIDGLDQSGYGGITELGAYADGLFVCILQVFVCGLQRTDDVSHCLDLCT
jgi:hypothetical protein